MPSKPGTVAKKRGEYTYAAVKKMLKDPRFAFEGNSAARREAARTHFLDILNWHERVAVLPEWLEIEESDPAMVSSITLCVFVRGGEYT